MKLLPLNLDDVAQRWKRLMPYISQIADLSSGRQSVQTLADLIREGKFKVWVIEDETEKDPEKVLRAMLMTEILEFPTGLRTGAIRGCAGKGKGRWRHLLPQLHEYFEKYGCAIVEVHGRAGWEMDAKQAGYKRTAMIFESPVKSEKLVEFGKIAASAVVLKSAPANGLDVPRGTIPQAGNA